MTLGSKLVKYRNAVPLSQEELAEKLEIPQKKLAFWESNLQEPNEEQRAQLGEILQVAVAELQSDEESGPIFKDHPEDLLVKNKPALTKAGISALVYGTLLLFSIFLVGFSSLIPGLVVTGMGFYWLFTSTPTVLWYYSILN